MKKSKSFGKSFSKAIFVYFLLVVVFVFSYNIISAIGWQSHEPDGKGSSTMERQSNQFICKHTNHWHSKSRYYQCSLSEVTDEIISHSTAIIFLLFLFGIIFHPVIFLTSITIISLLTASFYNHHSWMDFLVKKRKRKK